MKIDSRFYTGIATFIIALISMHFFYQYQLWLAILIGIISVVFVMTKYRSEVTLRTLEKCFLLVVAIFWLCSTYKENFRFSFLFIVGLLATVLYLYLFFLTLYKLLINEKVNPRDGASNSNHNTLAYKIISYLKYAVPLLIIWGGYLYGAVPGILTNDSFNQWKQATGITYYDAWHPLIHTFLIKLCSFVYYSPMSFIVIQLIAAITSISLMLVYFEKNRVPRFVLFSILFFYAVFPINGIYLATLWKDIPYSILLLTFTFLFYLSIKPGSNFLKQPRNIVLFVLISFLAMEFRKNGLIVVIICTVILIFKQNKRTILGILTVLLLGHMSFNWFCVDYLKSTQGPSTEAFSIPMQQIGATFKNKGTIDSEDAEYFEKILPKEKWINNYNTATVDPLKFDGEFNGEVIDNNPTLFIKHWWSTLRSNFGIYVKAYLDHTASLWRFYSPEDYEVYLGSREPTQTRPISQFVGYGNKNKEPLNELVDKSYQTYLKQMKQKNISKVQTFEEYQAVALKNVELFQAAPPNPRFSSELWKFIHKNQNEYQKYLYRGAIGVVLFLILLLAFLFRTKSGLIVIPAAINLLTLFVSVPATDYRYIYSLIFSLPLFFGILFIEKKKNV